MNQTIKELGERFKKRGFDYIELERSENGNVRLYSQWDGKRLAGYVVAMIKVQAPPPSWESEYDLHESFPSAEQFGKTAWQYMATQHLKAVIKFDAIAARKETKDSE